MNVLELHRWIHDVCEADARIMVARVDPVDGWSGPAFNVVFLVDGQPVFLPVSAVVIAIIATRTAIRSAAEDAQWLHACARSDREVRAHHAAGAASPTP